MRFHGRDIFSIPLRKSGITFAPELEERFAAQWAHYPFTSYKDLDGDEQAAVIASYRAHYRIEGVLAEAAQKAAKAKKR